MRLWKATVEWPPDIYWWASTDGEHFYEVNENFGSEREKEIRELFKSDEEAQRKPMCFTRRYLDHMKFDDKIKSVAIQQLV